MGKAGLIFCLIITGLMACDRHAEKASEKPLVKVGDQVLTYAVVEKLIHDDISKEDSVSVVNAYVDSWIRDRLMVLEAEKIIAEDLDLKTLLEEYRASLLLYHYENKLIAENLDTIVTDIQIQDYYDKNAVLYVLSHRIIRPAIFISTKELGRDQIQKLKRYTESEFNEFCTSNNLNSLCDEETWLGDQDFMSITKGVFPEFNTLDKNTVYSTYKNGKHYILRVHEIKEPNAVPPVSYIEDKLVQEILNQRKSELLLRFRDELFNKNMKSGAVKIYE
jgi:hypothetical protein